jgi:glycosyltransferase involved in cell wall biosynthesis
VTSTLVQHLDRKTVRPSICLLRAETTFPLSDDVTVHQLGYRGLPTFFGAARRLRRLINRHRPDVVVSTVNANALITGAALTGSRFRPPWIARIGSSPARHDRGLRAAAGRVYYPKATVYVVNSEGLAKEVVTSFPYSDGRVEIIRNTCDFDRIDLLSKESVGISRPVGPLLVAVGRLSRAKRYDRMLEALAIVQRSTPASLWICGDGPLRSSLEDYSRRLGLEGSVRWFGFLDNPYAVMRLADLFVLTSDYEGSPNALIEAQSLGLPAVSTRCPHGPDEIILDGGTGVLTTTDSATAIAEAIVTLFENQKEINDLAALARRSTR